ncbi:Peroxide stress regulator; Ferric uptake regulation protein; Fe2+/Zn2+ uptake regulation proteins [hydrothermal vent metagenome]|uniref:Peroxide stress regulator Ferric uptake regulation protein Fe2+/Zn2+ uptake regulation proteins n=1 Tax=hydrothermal vent metagenome TaxID=652676 RepID=A0A1W1D4L2_9ZZZZ
MNFIQLLQEHKLKATPQRISIVEALYAKGHMNIDDIYSDLHTKFPSISLATIYKNINTMLQIGFLNEVKIPNTKNVYELAKQEHSHVVCEKCGKIVDLSLDTSKLLQEASSKTHYELDKSSIVLEGLCQECQQN